MKTSKKILSLLMPVSAAVILCFSCKKDKPEPTPPAPVVPEPPGQKVYVLNEGNFNQNNGSVSLYDPKTKNVDPDRFGSQNSGAKLGDTPQNIILHGSSYFIVVNNSGKIVQCDLEMKKQKEITGFTSPRYIMPFSAEKAYVSDIAERALKIINLSSGTIEGSVQLTATAERLAVVGGKLFASSFASDYVYIVDIATQKLADSVNVGPGAGSMLVDKSLNLWVLSTGNYSDKPGKLVKINTTDNSIVQSLGFGTSQFPSRLAFSVTRDSLLYLLNGVNAVKLGATQLPVSPFIPGSYSLYGLGVNPKNGNVYVSDAIDFSQPARVLVYGAKGDSLTSFKAGPNASDFLFN